MHSHSINTRGERSDLSRCKVACEECRKRKIRCDRQEPCCGVCAESGTNCRFVPTRANRGPKKGVLRALRIENAELHRRLNGLHVELDTPEMSLCSAPDEHSNIVGDNGNTSPDIMPRSPSPVLRQRPVIDEEEQKFTLLSDLVKSDLNELFFERVHCFAPFVQKRRYLTWRNQVDAKCSRFCLQLAMWALAAQVSAQYQGTSVKLYEAARDALEQFELRGAGINSVTIAQAQAWLLISFYEFFKMKYERGWISIGRASRMTQILGLHVIDTSDRMTASGQGSLPGSNVEVEEQRRTFWVTYCLDRLISLRKNWPSAFNELAIGTRLPTSETHFQDGEHSVGKFLSETLTEDGYDSLSAFDELIIFVTIGGRCLAHKQQSLIEQIYGSGSDGFRDRQQWLHSLLIRNATIISKVSESLSTDPDPMHIFASLVAHTISIYFYKIQHWSPRNLVETSIDEELQKEALLAARKVVDLLRPMEELGIFKVHPFAPYAMYSAIKMLRWQDNSNVCYDSQIRQLLDCLRNLEPVNDMAAYYLQRLGT